MKLYLSYFSIHFRSRMQHKMSFFLTTMSQLLTTFSFFLALRFLLDRFGTVLSFTENEVLLCFSVVLMAFSLAECFFRGFDRFAAILGNGQFDRILVRPRSVLFQVIAQEIEFTRFGRFIQAFVVFIYVLPRCGILWTADKIVVLALMILCGMLEFAGLFIIYASLCFFSTDGLEFMNIFTDGGREFGSYPLAIYGEPIVKFFTYIIPMALWQLYPLCWLFGRNASPWMAFAPLLSLAFLIPCGIFWKIGIRHFRSTGS